MPSNGGPGQNLQIFWPDFFSKAEIFDFEILKSKS